MATKFLGDSFDLHAGGEDLMFPHHENEIAQSESASGKTFARHWMHVRFLLVEGKKMSKSEGNFYTLRDLLLKGYRASAIRFLLISVPYRHQLNFTFDGLTESTNAIERLRTFHQRMLEGQVARSAASRADTRRIDPQSAEPSLHRRARQRPEHRRSPRRHLRPRPRRQHRRRRTEPSRAATPPRSSRVLDLFDGVFAVLEDHDAELTRAALAWAETRRPPRRGRPLPVATLSFSDADIDALVAERTQAKKQRNFARADAIRNDLLDKGILLEGRNYHGYGVVAQIAKKIEGCVREPSRIPGPIPERNTVTAGKNQSVFSLGAAVPWPEALAIATIGIEGSTFSPQERIFDARDQYEISDRFRKVS